MILEYIFYTYAAFVVVVALRADREVEEARQVTHKLEGVLQADDHAVVANLKRKRREPNNKRRKKAAKVVFVCVCEQT